MAQSSKVLNFFTADSKRECIERFGKQPNGRIVHDDDQLCTTEYSRILPLENGEVSCTLKTLYFTSHPNSLVSLHVFLLNVPSRLWCLWSTAGRAPKTSRTRRCCGTSQRPPTSACASCAPAPCWLTWYPRHRETPLSHAGWALVTFTTSCR